jgi:hypothetical protein
VTFEFFLELGHFAFGASGNAEVVHVDCNKGGVAAVSAAVDAMFYRNVFKTEADHSTVKTLIP